MLDDMGIFRAKVTIAPLHNVKRQFEFAELIVDSDAVYSWLPRSVLVQIGVEPAWVERFIVADGKVIERDIGFAMFTVGDRSVPTIVVMGEPGDMELLGAVTLESLNLRIDLVSKELIPAGPVLAALVGLAA